MEETRNRFPAEVIKEITTRLNLNARITSWEDEDEVHIDVWGDDVAILIGRGGKTLDALQELVSTIVRRREGEKRRIIVDVERYKERKKKRIIERAKEAAEKALKLDRPVSLEPMTASERKIVHDALKDDRRIRTQSDGVEPERRIVIYPRKPTT
jgi:spoIIIJ-associated protein